MLPARSNPFRTSRVLELLRYRPPDGDWDRLVARFDALGRRAAVVGPHGSGKTTLLEDLAARLAGDGLGPTFLTLATDRRTLPASFWRDLAPRIGPGDLLVVDGADLLPRPAWLRLERAARRAGGLLAACHLPGRLPTLLETRTTPGLLRDLIATLADAPALSDPAFVAALFARHGGNLRECLRECYDRAGER